MSVAMFLPSLRQRSFNDRHGQTETTVRLGACRVRSLTAIAMRSESILRYFESGGSLDARITTHDISTVAELDVVISS